MEKWHGGAYVLSLVDAPAQRENPAVIQNSALGLNSSFGKAGCAGGIENLRGISWTDRYLAFTQLIEADLLTGGDHLAEERGPPAFLLQQTLRGSAQQADVAQPGERFAVDCAVLRARGNHGAYSSQAIMIAHARHEEERSHIALSQNILHFLRTQDGVDSDEHQSGFRCRQFEQWPLWKIDGPDGDMLSFFEVELHQAACYGIDPFAVLLIRPANVERAAKFGVARVDKRFLRRNL